MNAQLSQSSPATSAAAAATAPILEERSYPGLHEEIFACFERYVRPRQSVLDLACGTGAWLARLKSHGYEDLMGMDADAASFGLSGTGFACANLDRPFTDAAQGRRFDAITAMEIIEHLESPADFLRQARALIKDDGYFFLTTPNVESVQGRLRFLLSGRLRCFEDDGSGDPTHISPLLSSLFPRLTARSGWIIAAQVPLLTHSSRPHVRLVCGLLAPLLGGRRDGDCHLFILRPGPR